MSSHFLLQWLNYPCCPENCRNFILCMFPQQASCPGFADGVLTTGKHHYKATSKTRSTKLEQASEHNVILALPTGDGLPLVAAGDPAARWFVRDGRLPVSGRKEGKNSSSLIFQLLQYYGYTLFSESHGGCVGPALPSLWNFSQV